MSVFFSASGTLIAGMIKDKRTRCVLEGVSLATGPVGPRHVIAMAISVDRDAASILDKASRNGKSAAFVHSVQFKTDCAVSALPRTSFSPTVLRALDKVDQALRDAPAMADDITLDLLLHCILVLADETDRLDLAFFDLSKAADLFRSKIYSDATKRTTGIEGLGGLGEECVFHLPPEIASSDDLTSRVRGAPIFDAPPFDGVPAYERLFDALARVLHRQRSNHVLLTGERGVGKSSLAAELARRAATRRIPFLADARFLSVDCRYVAPDETRQRLAALLDHIGPRAELVVCLDGLGVLLRSDRPAANRAVLLAGLNHARCRLIGLLTPRECDEILSDDPDLAEFFTRVEVEEPEPEDALRLLRHYSIGLEKRFRLRIDDASVQQAVRLSATYIINDQLPAKALKVLYRACETVDYERTIGNPSCDRVTADDILAAVSIASGVPVETLHGVAERLDYAEALGDLVFGQEHAVRTVASELGLIKAGMTDGNKPASVLLFLGQTGTGKTELAKALARLYSTTRRLKTYTLGNCVEPHSVSTIIGVPPGYVGHEQGGRLINELCADPYGVFLLDEVDKAHPDVLQPFLNLFDEGWVSDQRGVRAYASKSIFILTSNVGQRMIAELVQQGKPHDEIASRMKEALSQIRHGKSDRPVFTAEFIARIKRIIVFNPLSADAMLRIARKQVGEIQGSWSAKRCKRLHIPHELISRLAGEAHRLNELSHGKEGGRIVRKLVADWIETPLQQAISRSSAEYRVATTIALRIVSEIEEAIPRVEVQFSDAPTDAGQG